MGIIKNRFKIIFFIMFYFEKLNTKSESQKAY